jgi:hypothetical protein
MRAVPVATRFLAKRQQIPESAYGAGILPRSEADVADGLHAVAAHQWGAFHRQAAPRDIYSSTAHPAS